MQGQNSNDSSSVVNTLGIAREKNSFGYAVQEVGGSAVNSVIESNFVESLSGKLSGVHIIRPNTLGGSSDILIRGRKSFKGNNQPLFVIDGIPVDNSNYATGADGFGGYDYGNLVQDLNPADIESVSVLKGVNATALYGSRGGNGVLLISTKKGRTNGGIGVSVNSSFVLGSIDKTTLPQHQYEYGAGYGPFYDDQSRYFFETDLDGDGTLDRIVPTSEDASWGHPFDPSMDVIHWWALDPRDPGYAKKSPWTAPDSKNRMSSFFENSSRWVNSVAFDGGDENGRFRLSYTNFNENGIVPNSKLKKHNVSFTGNYRFTKRLNVSTSIMYNHQNAMGRMGTGSDNQNVMQSFGQWYQTNVGMEEMKSYASSDGLQRTWNYAYYDKLTPMSQDNPFWVRFKNYNDDYRHRLLGHISADYLISDWLSFTLRSAIDTYRDMQNERIAVGSVATSDYTNRERSVLESNTDLLLKLNKRISRFSFAGMVGGNYRYRSFGSSFNSTVGGLLVPDLYTISNSVLPASASEFQTTYKELGLYGMATLGFGDFIFLEGTLRVDKSFTWKSAGGDDPYSYFCPSIAGSLLFHEMGGMKDLDWMNYLKLRMNFGRSGSSYSSNTKYEPSGGIELGIDGLFFNSRLGFDMSVYKTSSEDLHISIPVGNTNQARYSYSLIGGMENKGLELSMHVVPVRSGKFSWQLELNWFANRNKVTSLGSGIGGLEIMSAWDVQVSSIPGEPYGTITGSDYVYTDEKITVKSNGYLMVGDDRLAILGNIQPDYNMGIGNRFKWHGISLYVLLDMQHGGDLYSVSTKYGQATGLYIETAGENPRGNPKRDQVEEGGGLIYEDAVFEDGTPNNVYIPAYRWSRYWAYSKSPTARYIFDASYVKLRELSLSYSIPQSLLGDFFIRGINITLVGRNLWIIRKEVAHFDPEYMITSGNQQGIEHGAYPSVRTIGMNLKFNF